MNNYGTYYAELDKLKLILNSFTDAVLLESKDRTIEFVNQSFCNLFKIKLSIESIIGSNCEEGVIASSFQFKNPSRFIYRIEEIIEELKPIQKEEVILRDGRLFYRDYLPVIINNVHTGHLWVYKEVISTTQPASNSVQPVINLFEEIVNTIDISIAVLDREKKYLFINKASLPDNKKRSFLIGRTDFEYYKYYSIPHTYNQTGNDCFLKTIDEGVATKFDELSKDFSGNECYKTTTYCPLSSENGIVEKVLSYSIDLTKEKEIADRLTADIEAFKHSLNSISEAVLVADGNLELKYSNYSFKEHLLHEKVDVHTIFDFISFQNYDFYKQLFSVLSGDISGAGGRIQLTDKNDSTNWYKYNINKGIESNGNKQSGIVTVLNNISEEVALEENLLEVVKREKELNELKSAFVNMVSHEMRTPLAIISSCAELIQLMIASGKPKEDIEAYAGHIISEVERMTAFMNDILIISKIEAGKIEFNPETISLSSFLDEIIKKGYLPWKDNRSLEFSIKGNERVFPFDNKMLRHILQNLLDNAFKYSANKAAPKLRLRFSKNYITFSVIDAGIGIHPEDVEKLFSSFSRGRNVGNIYGTGIGLVVVKYFVDLHKGTISIKSKLNVGTIFSIKIPY